MTGLAATLAGAVLVGAGLFVAVAAAVRRSRRRVHNLEQLLELAYLESDPAAAASGQVSRLLARSGVVAERALGNTGLISRIRAKIEHSDWTVGPGEFVAISAAAGAAGAFVGAAAGSLPLALLLGGAGAAGPLVLVNRSVERRRARFEEQFPEVLDLMAASLESGASIAQAIELVVAESDEPVAGEFGRVLSAARLGAPFVDALTSMGERIGSRDLTWTIQAIVIQQRTGGRLADILRTVAEFMRAREEVRREMRALTAEGRMSAYILGALPFVVATVLLLLRPDYLDPLFTTAPGLLLLAGAGVLLAAGFTVMSRMIKVEV